MSVLGKKWIIKNTNSSKTIFERILANRGLSEIVEMEDFHDPFLFTDMAKSVERINKAIKDQERIIIFGDYDVDGISGSAILVNTLKKLKANVSFRLPNRSTDGYGLSIKFIDEFIEKNIGLVITVDCGICCRKEIQKAKENNIDTIITDHHTIPDQLPESAFAILHPKNKDSNYPFSELTGAGVALKLAHALIKNNLPEHEQEEYLNSLLDLATLGTIADLGSLQGENRLIVRRGLNALRSTRWAGLKRLKEIAGLKAGEEVDVVKIGYQIAPRINAAGRIGDPYTALFLLLGEEDNAQMGDLANKLEELNRKRQFMSEKAFEEAGNFVTDLGEMPTIIIAHSPDWHVGILGLIAGKLAEKNRRPTIVMQDLGDTLVASARSPVFFNVIEAIASCGEFLTNFGGHAQAAGFSLKKENLEAFKSQITAYSNEKLSNMEISPTLEIDAEIFAEDMNFDLLDALEKLQPFGVDNRKPLFIIKNVTPSFISQVGSTKTHLKFDAHSSDKKFPVIAFRMGEFSTLLKDKKSIDLVFEIERHTWNNRTELQLHALDFNCN
ncbi:MAG: single-stranded-DNA-specific exonuclease RecJ [Patescibacteria group bacterium]